jgi:hypothetical protein
MKSANTAAALFALALGIQSGVARADSQEMSDPGSRRLARMLKGHTLVCGPVDAKRSKQEKGFYPVTVTATEKEDGNVTLAVETGKKGLAFGMGGSELDPVETTPSWVIVSSGDDGRRYIQFNTITRDELKPEHGNTCDEEQIKKHEYDGQTTGLIYEIWDAGNSGAESVICCLRKP